MSPRSTEHPVLLLDVMGTLVHDPFFEEGLRFFGMSLDDLMAAKDIDAWIEFESGTIDEATHFERFFKDRRSFDGAGLREGIRRGYRWLDGIEELLGELSRRKVSMHALSDYSVWYQMIEEKLQLSRFLEWTFVSCRTGVLKPAPEAFKGAAQTLGVETSRCIFVDDKPANCRAARETGMTALEFIGADQLREDLAGILGD